MATVGTVRANLIANLEKWGPNFALAEEDLARFADSTRRYGSTTGEIMRNQTAATNQSTSAIAEAAMRGQISFGNLAKAAGVVGAAYGALKIADRMVEWEGAYIAAGAAAERFAERVGMSITTLQGLEYAAERTGSSAEMIRGALNMMTRHLGGIGPGASQAAKALEQIGLDASHIRRMGPDKAFLEIAEALKQTTDASVRAAAATAIFGRGTTDLITLLMQGKEGLRGFLEEAQRLEKTLTEEEGRRMLLYQQRWSLFKNQLAAPWRRLGREIATGLEDAAYQVFGWGESYLEAAEKIEKARASAEKLRKETLRQNAELEKQQRLAAEQAARMEAVYGPIRRAQQAGGELRRRLEAQATLGGLEGPEREIRQWQLEAAHAGMALEQYRGFAKRLEPLAAEIRRQEAAREATRRAEEAREDFRRRAEQIEARMRTPAEVFRDEMRELQQLLTLGALPLVTFERAVNAAYANFQRALGIQEERPPRATLFGEAMERGSARAWEVMVAAQTNLRPDRQAEMLKAEKDQLAQLELVNNLLRELAETLHFKLAQPPA